MRRVVLVDEYDKPLLDVMATGLTIESEGNKIPLEDYNREILKSFYSTFKIADDDLQFVFLTGVTKFSQQSVFGGFNQPRDISMRGKYETIRGLTDEEIEHYFHTSIEEMAEEEGLTYSRMRGELRKKYDGYHFSKRMKGAYNPFSLLNAFAELDTDNYWFKTGTPSYLIRLLEKSNEGLDMFTGKHFEDYRANSRQPLPMIFQSGYLTIKAFNERKQKFLLDFPNDEVKKGSATLVANSCLKTEKTGS